MKTTKIFTKSAGAGCTDFEYFRHARQDVAIFENLLGEWTAESQYTQVTAPTKEAAIQAYKAKCSERDALWN